VLSLCIKKEEKHSSYMQSAVVADVKRKKIKHNNNNTVFLLQGAKEQGELKLGTEKATHMLRQ
jgi:hypothetical protein